MAAWTVTPMTAVAGAVLTAAQWNTNVRDFSLAHSTYGTFTPVLAGFTPGNGVGSGRYKQILKSLDANATFTFGTSSAAVAAVPTLTIPVAALSTSLNNIIEGYFEGPNKYRAACYLASTTTVALTIWGTNGITGTPSSSTPFTWATGHAIHYGLTIETA